MAHRFSRADKGKWQEEPRPPKKPLIRIPESNVSDLIEKNKFTLIGRVTNPAIQKTRALVDFFLQHWNVVGRITGRPLGPNLFQFSFESEKDMQVILSKAPFHFKRWMLILQRWEPVVSDSFPDRITFWINIHGIPLHYWNDGAIDAIGEALGPIVTRDVDRARLRVQINGLQPLIMCMDIELPSKAVVEIELEYENLDKHCFLCKSLSHEDNDCYLKPPRTNGERRHTSTSQQNTLEKLEEEKRRQADRRYARQNQPSHREGARWTNFKASRDAPPVSQEVYSKGTSGRSSGFEENHRRYDDRTLREYKTPSYDNRSSQKRQYDPAPSVHTSQWRVRESQEPKETVSPSREASSQSKRSPSATAEVNRKRNLDSRLSDPRTNSANREERPSAKERLSVHTQRTSSNERRDSEITLSQERLPATERLSTQTQRISPLERLEVNAASERVLVVDNQTREEPHSPRNNMIITRPSSSNVFGSGRLGPGERSPIRTLSDDRIHVSLRLGPLLSDKEEEDAQQDDLPLLSKAAGKRKADGEKPTKKTSRSLTQGVAVKRRRTTKAQNSPRRASPRKNSPRRNPPRRKLMADAIVAGGGLSGVSRSTPKGPKIIPPIVKKGKDFHPPPPSLP